MTRTKNDIIKEFLKVQNREFDLRCENKDQLADNFVNRYIDSSKKEIIYFQSDLDLALKVLNDLHAKKLSLLKDLLCQHLTDDIYDTPLDNKQIETIKKGIDSQFDKLELENIK